MPGINVLSKDGPGQGQDGEKRKMLWAYAGLILYFFVVVVFWPPLGLWNSQAGISSQP